MLFSWEKVVGGPLERYRGNTQVWDLTKLAYAIRTKKKKEKVRYDLLEMQQIT